MKGFKGETAIKFSDFVNSVAKEKVSSELVESNDISQMTSKMRKLKI